MHTPCQEGALVELLDSVRRSSLALGKVVSRQPVKFLQLCNFWNGAVASQPGSYPHRCGGRYPARTGGPRCEVWQSVVVQGGLDGVQQSAGNATAIKVDLRLLDRR